MKNWAVTIKIQDESPEELVLTDANEVLEGYLNITRTFFDELLNIVKVFNKYAIGKGIEKVIGPDGKEWTYNPWILFMGKDQEIQLPFWLLMKREKDLSGNLVAIGPEPYLNYCVASKEPDDNIKRLLEFFIAYPQKFKISMIIPNYVV